MSSQPLRIGIFGLGVVGGGVVELLKFRPDYIIKKAYVQNLSKKRDLSQSIPLIASPDDILEDPEIDCIVEVMGGTTFAWDIIKKAIMNNKHVVTANKALISKYMNPLIDLLQNHPMVCFFYEASVCGGIPIIATMKQALAPDQITRIAGIMNGTTNYMLSNMATQGKEYSDVLKEAQQEGYAESDPSADVLGWDARSKLCILTKLAFGTTLEEETIPCLGINQIHTTDFEYAHMLNRTIKLLGMAETTINTTTTNGKNENSRQEIAVSVCPVMIPLADPLAHVDGATNAVCIDSNNLGTSLLIGPGAGRYPTANSVVADIMRLREYITNGPKTEKISTIHGSMAFGSSERLKATLATDYEADYYIRLVCDDHVGVIHKVSEILAKHNIPIFSIMQTPIKNHRRVPFAVITEKCKLSSIQNMKEEFQQRRQKDLQFILEEPLCLRYFPDS